MKIPFHDLCCLCSRTDFQDEHHPNDFVSWNFPCKGLPPLNATTSHDCIKILRNATPRYGSVKVVDPGAKKSSWNLSRRQMNWMPVWWEKPRACDMSSYLPWIVVAVVAVLWTFVVVIGDFSRRGSSGAKLLINATMPLFFYMNKIVRNKKADFRFNISFMSVSNKAKAYRQSLHFCFEIKSKVIISLICRGWTSGPCCIYIVLYLFVRYCWRYSDFAWFWRRRGMSHRLAPVTSVMFFYWHYFLSHSAQISTSHSPDKSCSRNVQLNSLLGINQ